MPIGRLMSSFDRLGVDVRLDSTVERIEAAGEGVTVFARADGEVFSIDADLVIHAAGRRPALADLGLDCAGRRLG